VDALAIREYAFGAGVTAIEWADRLPAGRWMRTFWFG